MRVRGRRSYCGRHAADDHQEPQVPRYIVERTFPAGARIPGAEEDPAAVQGLVDRNGDYGVTWLQSYVASGGGKTFCVYDAPSPEAIRRTAHRNGLPVDRITQVSVLDPYAYAESSTNGSTAITGRASLEDQLALDRARHGSGARDMSEGVGTPG
jgi:hypothetical protein